ncbi:MAG: biotin/lipoyl-binding protein, partial [Acinetobacter sp.]
MTQQNIHPDTDNNSDQNDSSLDTKQGLESNSLTEQHNISVNSDVSNVDVSDINVKKDEDLKPNEQSIAPNDSSKKKALLAIGTIIFIALLGLIAFGLWKSYQPKTIDVQGRVEAETLHVSTKVPSRIEGIFVHDGQKVEKGQLLVTLSSPEISTSKQQALASLQSALALQSSVDRGAQQENIDSLYANWQSMKAQENLAKTTFNRGQNLYQQGVISRQRRDEMQAAAIS